MTSGSDSSSPHSTIRSYESIRGRMHRKSQNLDPPQSFTRVHNVSLQSDSEIFFTDGPIVISPKLLSRNLRLQLSHRGNSENNSGHWSSRSRLSSTSSIYDENTKRIAVGLILNEDLRHFVFQHISLIEAEIFKLQTQIAKAFLSKTKFLELIHEGWIEMAHNICLLHNSPRLQSPVWLSLIRQEENYEIIARTFCSNLASVLKNFDLKTTHFFFSKLLSCVLMNHLSWVASVAQRDCHKNETQHSLLFGTCENSEQSYGLYNIHLAQHLEVCGNISGLIRSARTVVIGSETKIISQLLYLLTYFIRCSEIHRNEKVRTKQSNIGNEISKPLVSQQKYEGIDSAIKDRCSDNQLISTIFEEKFKNVDSDWHFSLSNIIMASKSFDLAHSLLAGPCDSYCSHFVLSGLCRSNIDYEILSSLTEHVKNGDYEIMASSSSLGSSNSSTVSDSSSVTPSVIVIADVNNFTVKTIVGDEITLNESQMASPCDIIVTMLEQFIGFYDMGASPNILLAIIENTLSEILRKSLSLIAVLNSADDAQRGGEVDNFYDKNFSDNDKKINFTNSLSSEHIAEIIGCDYSDLRLIVNVAAVYYPPVLHLVVC